MIFDAMRLPLIENYLVSYLAASARYPVLLRFRLYHASGVGTLALASELFANRGPSIMEVDRDVAPDHRLAHRLAVGLSGEAFARRPSDDCFCFVAHTPENRQPESLAPERFRLKFASLCATCPFCVALSCDQTLSRATLDCILRPALPSE